MNENIVSYIKEHRPIKKPGSHIEVEFRYKATKDIIKKFLLEFREYFAEKSEISKTVNMIYSSKNPAEPNFLRIRDHITGQLTLHLKHKKVSDLRDFYSINISTEQELKSEPSNIKGHTQVIRIKLRLSIPHAHGRFDITQVATISDPNQMKKAIIDSAKITLFDRINDKSTPVEKYDQFLANFGNSCITSVEMEYEFNENTYSYSHGNRTRKSN
jgi:hypothetical protein